MRARAAALAALSLCAGAALLAGVQPRPAPPATAQPSWEGIDAATGLPVELAALMKDSRCGSGEDKSADRSHTPEAFRHPVRVAETSPNR